MKLFEWISDWRIERKLKKSFKLRNDLQASPAATVPIEIIRGDYKGLVYQYGTVQFDENRVSYHYTSIENGHLIDAEFIKFGGTLLTYLIRKKSYYDIISRSPQNWKKEIYNDQYPSNGEDPS